MWIWDTAPLVQYTFFIVLPFPLRGSEALRRILINWQRKDRLGNTEHADQQQLGSWFERFLWMLWGFFILFSVICSCCKSKLTTPACDFVFIVSDVWIQTNSSIVTFSKPSPAVSLLPTTYLFYKVFTIYMFELEHSCRLRDLHLTARYSEVFMMP